jgi:hypothetical protein
VTNCLDGGTLHAYTSNHAPANGDTLATYTALEAAFGGYAPITCSAWGAAYLNAANVAESDETVRVWTASGSGLPVTVYGVFYKDVNGNLMYAELFQTPVPLSAAGQTVAYQPVFTGQSEF